MFTIFKTFFWPGWFSFGGPAAHIGYFRQTFVEKLKWLDDSEYAQIVALSQFLPGPGSSQVGFALGYKHGGLGGACAAFVGFTLPSVVIMLALAMVSSQITDTAVFQNIVHGLNCSQSSSWRMRLGHVQKLLPKQTDRGFVHRDCDCVAGGTKHHDANVRVDRSRFCRNAISKERLRAISRVV